MMVDDAGALRGGLVFGLVLMLFPVIWGWRTIFSRVPGKFGIFVYYFCLGAGFARLELKVMFEELFRRFPDIELDGKPERLRSTFIGGIKHLPVKFTPES